MTTIKIEGLEELIRATARIGQQAMPIIKIESDKAGKVILEAAKQNVSVKSGALQKNLKQSKRKIKAGKLSTFNYVGFDKKHAYGVPLELGHRLIIKGTPAGAVTERPFLRPAADANKTMTTDAITAGMDKALNELGGKK